MFPPWARILMTLFSCWVVLPRSPLAKKRSGQSVSAEDVLPLTGRFCSRHHARGGPVSGCSCMARVPTWDLTRGWTWIVSIVMPLTPSESRISKTISIRNVSFSAFFDFFRGFSRFPSCILSSISDSCGSRNLRSFVSALSGHRG